MHFMQRKALDLNGRSLCLMPEALLMMAVAMLSVLVVVGAFVYESNKRHARHRAKDWDRVKARHLCEKLTGRYPTTNGECARICKTMHQRLGRECGPLDECRHVRRVIQGRKVFGKLR